MEKSKELLFAVEYPVKMQKFSWDLLISDCVLSYCELIYRVLIDT